MSNNAKLIIRIFIALFIMAVGTTLLVAFPKPVSSSDIVLNALGLTLAVAGAVTALKETAIGVLPDTRSMEESARGVAELNERISNMSNLLKGAGMTMIASQRQDYSRYHDWASETAPQNMYFAGHSVLHRVEIDFKQRRLVSVEQAILRKLQEGSHIKILFLDPTWEYLEKIADAEGEDLGQLRSNLGITVTICCKIWSVIHEEDLPGAIEIRTCREFVQYAFHHVSYRNTDDPYMLIGFYFADSDGGMNTPLFSVDNQEIRQEFSSHFATVFRRSKEKGGRRLLQYCEHGEPKSFNKKYYEECHAKTGVDTTNMDIPEHCKPETWGGKNSVE